MASFDAIAAVGQAIRALLSDAATGIFPDASFDLFQAGDFPKPRDGMGVSIFLYRVAANTTQRNLPPRVTNDGRRFRPSLALDLHYMLTPWAPTSDTQHRLLGWAMRVLEDTPILPAAYVNAHESQGDTFRPEETVELVYDPLSLQDLSNLWEVLEPKLQPTATYVARRIDIESSREIIDGAIVQRREFGVGRLVTS
jgi:hypothetical protein